MFQRYLFPKTIILYGTAVFLPRPERASARETFPVQKTSTGATDTPILLQYNIII